MSSKEFCRPDPEELLRQITAQEAHDARGRLKIFLGYAPRVGKSLRMFDEGPPPPQARAGRRHRRHPVKGADDFANLIREFEVIPPLRMADNKDTTGVAEHHRRRRHSRPPAPGLPDR